jgi:hypothetical protein
MPKIIIFQKITCAKNASPCAELPLKFSDQLIEALIGGANFFSQNGPCRVSKCPSFCVDFQNVNLPWGQNAPKKKLFPKNCFLPRKIAKSLKISIFLK